MKKTVINTGIGTSDIFHHNLVGIQEILTEQDETKFLTICLGVSIMVMVITLTTQLISSEISYTILSVALGSGITAMLLVLLLYRQIKRFGIYAIRSNKQACEYYYRLKSCLDDR